MCAIGGFNNPKRLSLEFCMSEVDGGGALPSFLPSSLQRSRFCACPSFFVHILNASCLLSSVGKVSSFLTLVCEKEEDPRAGGLDNLWCTNNEPLFLNEKAYMAF
jgi:hypothetical protein